MSVVEYLLAGAEVFDLSFSYFSTDFTQIQVAVRALSSETENTEEYRQPKIQFLELWLLKVMVQR